MLFTIQELIEGRGKPVSVLPTCAVVDALMLMSKHDFSQLPVIDDEERPVGMITGRSILQAAGHCGVTLEALGVRDAKVAHKSVRVDSDLFEVLDDIQLSDAVLVVDGNDRLKGIITNFDTTVFFRGRAEDMMFVEDVESRVCDFIKALYSSKAEGSEDLNEAIDAVTNSARQMRRRFDGAVKSCLSKLELTNLVIDQTTLDQAFKRLGVAEGGKSFEDLTFNELMDVLLRHAKCPRLAHGDGVEAVRRLLKGVRDTRNKLAHFRGEISHQEREQLRYCAHWLEHAYDEVFPPTASSSPKPVQAVDEGKNREIQPLDEAPDSILAPIILELRGLAPDISEYRLNFRDISGRLNCKLPKAALEHRAWWSNDPENVHANQWLEEGWTVYNVVRSLSGGKEVIFKRIGEREKYYIAFFKAVLVEMARHKQFPLRKSEPEGRSYFRLADLPHKAKKRVYLFAAFSRSKQIRVELYIDVGSKRQNKAIFQGLRLHQSEIEGQLEVILSWEEMEGNKASRIALYRAGAVTGAHAEQQAAAWVADTAEKMNRVITPFLKTVVEKM